MSYVYATERPWLFTEDGQLALLKARDNAFALLDQAGAFKGFKALRNVHVGDTWKMLALLDRLVELGDVVEVTPAGTSGQHRVFMRPHRD